MFSIEPNIKDNSSYSYVYPRDKQLCLLMGISSSSSKKEIEGYINLVDLISKNTNVVLVIDPTIKYDVVTELQKDNVHILRISLSTNLNRQNSPFYLINKEEKILSVITNKEVSNQIKNINLDLYIPNLIKEYDLSKYSFNYDIYFDVALITLNEKRYEKNINDFFNKVLKIKKCIFLYSDRKYFARFLNKDNVIINANPNEANYIDNIKKLDSFSKLELNITDDLLSNYLILNNDIFIENTLFNKNKDALQPLCSIFQNNINYIDFKSHFKNSDLYQLFVQIPYSSKHEYYDK